jgi:histidinol-phosphate aminotransferase
VIRLRTFSKGYGLAGARVGYAIAAPDLIAAFDKVRNHFGLNRSAQIGALAALEDQDWLAQTIAARRRLPRAAGRHRRRERAAALPSAANFVAIDCGGDGDFARAVLAGWARAASSSACPSSPRMDRCIRVSCGPEDQIARFAKALPEALAAVRAR